MSFLRLLSLEPQTSIEERLLFEMQEFCGSKRCMAEYFDFYLEDKEDYRAVKFLIECSGFEVELLTFDEQLIYRDGMSDIRIPPVQLLRIYNENEINRYPADKEGHYSPR